jgi:hypothetical protein
VVNVSDLDELRQRSNALLVQFLNTDLDLGFTFLNTANLASDPAHRQQAIEDVLTVLEAVRKFEHRVGPMETQVAITARADDLERALNEILPAFACPEMDG